MKLKHKKIIALEGLIILSIFLFLVGSFFVPETYTVINNDEPIDLFLEKRLSITDTKDGTIYTVIINRSDFVEKVDGFNFTQADILKELGDRGKLEGVKGLNIVKKEISLASYKENLLLFLLLSYPLYLIFRFILWAKNTLRKVEN
ncbi:MAG: hypothetical protein RPU34_12030 [Candidatus Sedimenticola sp. (ex Thyasira tokunagai)]